MSLNDAHAFAFSFATTPMAVIIIFQAGDGTLSVMPATEYDGDTAAIINDDRSLRPLIGASRPESGDRSRFPLPARLDLPYIHGAPVVVVVEGATVRPCHGDHHHDHPRDTLALPTKNCG